MATLVLTRGLPASGKTTWARAWVREDQGNRVRLNRDDFRQMLFGLDAGGLTSFQEDAVTAAQHGAIEAALRSGRSVVADDTNLRARNVRALADVARRAGAEFEVVEFQTDPDTCIDRDRARSLNGGRQVGSDVIRSFADRYWRKTRLVPLALTEQATVLPTTYAGDTSLARAWIFDVDGTLAHMDDRRGPFDWHRVDEDRLDTTVRDVAQALEARGDNVLVVSGRDGSCEEKTRAWLHRCEIPFTELYMRPAGDVRKDSVVKAEIFWEQIAPDYFVLGVFDDRDQVVEMWRAMGLKCFQVAPGNF